MTENMLIAAFSALTSIIGTFGGILVSSRLTNYRLEALEKKVQRHNNFIERVYILEEKVKVANHRLEDLEHGRESKCRNC